MKFFILRERIGAVDLFSSWYGSSFRHQIFFKSTENMKY